MGDVAVIGGGLVGQLVALMLARRGHQVVVVDEDPGPAAHLSAQEDFFSWPRRRVAQAHHGHVFRARVARVLRDEAPDVVSAMLRHGISKAGINFGDGFEEDFALMARRPVFEAALRRVVQQQNSIELQPEHRVTRLLTGNGHRGAPVVTGIRTSDGDDIPAQLVVDCGGRRSQAPALLRSIGASLGADDYQPCDLHYFARHYELLPGTDFPNTTFPDGAHTPYGIFLAMAQDNQTFCLAGALSKIDPLRSCVRDGRTFDRLMAALPRMNEWSRSGAPITDVQVMAGLANRRRSLLKDGQLTVEGYVLVGDSSLYTNATLGQGVALGFWQAQALAKRAELIGRDQVALAVGLEQWTNAVLAPWYSAQVRIDAAMVNSLHAGVHGAPMMRGKDPRSAIQSLGAAGDSAAAAAFYRIDNLLTDLDQELADPWLCAKVKAFLDDLEVGPTGPGPLPRREFESLLA